MGAITLADVAAEIGLNLKSLRYYFVRKEDLVAAAFIESIAIHCRMIDEAESASGQVTERLKAFVSAVFDHHQAVRRGEIAEYLHFGDIRALTEPQSLMVWPAYNDMFRRVRRLLRTPETSALGRIWLNTRSHALISQTLWSVVWLPTYETEDLNRTKERFLDILLNGLSAHDHWRSVTLSPPSEMTDPDRLSQWSFLRAATLTINALGYRGASVEQISAELKVTKGAFYHHNETKEDLIKACFNRTFNLIEQAQNAAREVDALSGLEQVTSVATSLSQWHLSGAAPLLRTSALTVVDYDIRLQMVQRMNHLTDRFTDMLVDGMIDGSARSCDPRVGAQMVTAMINSAEELQRWAPQASADNVGDLYIRPLFEGLLTIRPQPLGADHAEA